MARARTQAAATPSLKPSHVVSPLKLGALLQPMHATAWRLRSPDAPTPAPPTSTLPASQRRQPQPHHAALSAPRPTAPMAATAASVAPLRVLLPPPAAAPHSAAAAGGQRRRAPPGSAPGSSAGGVDFATPLAHVTRQGPLAFGTTPLQPPPPPALLEPFPVGSAEYPAPPLASAAAQPEDAAAVLAVGKSGGGVADAERRAMWGPSAAMGAWLLQPSPPEDAAGVEGVGVPGAGSGGPFDDALAQAHWQDQPGGVAATSGLLVQREQRWRRGSGDGAAAAAFGVDETQLPEHHGRQAAVGRAAHVQGGDEARDDEEEGLEEAWQRRAAAAGGSGEGSGGPLLRRDVVLSWGSLGQWAGRDASPASSGGAHASSAGALPPAGQALAAARSAAPLQALGVEGQAPASLALALPPQPPQFQVLGWSGAEVLADVPGERAAGRAARQRWGQAGISASPLLHHGGSAALAARPPSPQLPEPRSAGPAALSGGDGGAAAATAAASGQGSQDWAAGAAIALLPPPPLSHALLQGGAEEREEEEGPAPSQAAAMERVRRGATEGGAAALVEVGHGRAASSVAAPTAPASAEVSPAPAFGGDGQRAAPPPPELVFDLMCSLAPGDVGPASPLSSLSEASWSAPLHASPSRREAHHAGFQVRAASEISCVASATARRCIIAVATRCGARAQVWSNPTFSASRSREREAHLARDAARRSTSSPGAASSASTSAPARQTTATAAHAQAHAWLVTPASRSLLSHAAGPTAPIAAHPSSLPIPPPAAPKLTPPSLAAVVPPHGAAPTVATSAQPTQALPAERAEDAASEHGAPSGAGSGVVLRRVTAGEESVRSSSPHPQPPPPPPPAAHAAAASEGPLAALLQQAQVVDAEEEVAAEWALLTARTRQRQQRLAAPASDHGAEPPQQLLQIVAGGRSVAVVPGRLSSTLGEARPALGAAAGAPALAAEGEASGRAAGGRRLASTDRGGREAGKEGLTGAGGHWGAGGVEGLGRPRQGVDAHGQGGGLAVARGSVTSTLLEGGGAPQGTLGASSRQRTWQRCALGAPEQGDALARNLQGDGFTAPLPSAARLAAARLASREEKDRRFAVTLGLQQPPGALPGRAATSPVGQWGAPGPAAKRLGASGAVGAADPLGAGVRGTVGSEEEARRSERTGALLERLRAINRATRASAKLLHLAQQA